VRMAVCVTIVLVYMFMFMNVTFFFTGFYDPYGIVFAASACSAHIVSFLVIQ